GTVRVVTSPGESATGTSSCVVSGVVLVLVRGAAHTSRSPSSWSSMQSSQPPVCESLLSTYRAPVVVIFPYRAMLQSYSQPSGTGAGSPLTRFTQSGQMWSGALVSLCIAVASALGDRHARR